MADQRHQHRAGGDALRLALFAKLGQHRFDADQRHVSRPERISPQLCCGQPVSLCNSGHSCLKQVNPANGSVNYINLGAFTLPATKTSTGALSSPFGNAPRNIGRTPKFFETDLDLNKRFNTPMESMKVEFRAEAYNVFNHTNLYLPGGTSGSTLSGTYGGAAASGGTITGALEPRILQFGLKILYLTFASLFQPPARCCLLRGWLFFVQATALQPVYIIGIRKCIAGTGAAKRGAATAEAPQSCRAGISPQGGRDEIPRVDGQQGVWQRRWTDCADHCQDGWAGSCWTATSSTPLPTQRMWIPAWCRHYDEHVVIWLQRLNQQAMRSAALAAGLELGDNSVFDAEEMVRITQKIVEEAYAEGNCVIVGRGSQCVLQHKPDVYHVFVYAPLKERLLRLRARLEKGANTEQRIRKVDGERAKYLQQYFGKNWCSMHLYHLMICSCQDEDSTARAILYAMTGEVTAAQG